MRNNFLSHHGLDVLSILRAGGGNLHVQLGSKVKGQMPEPAKKRNGWKEAKCFLIIYFQLKSFVKNGTISFYFIYEA